MWCPNCKTEYREGVTVCADCGAQLVERLAETEDQVLLVALTEAPMAEKLLRYLDYSGIKATLVPSSEKEEYCIYVKKKSAKQASKCFAAFYVVEAEQAMQQKDSDAESVEEIETLSVSEDLEEGGFFREELTADEQAELREADTKAKTWTADEKKGLWITDEETELLEADEEAGLREADEEAGLREADRKAKLREAGEDAGLQEADMESDEDEAVEEPLSGGSATYVPRLDKYKDLRASAVMFLLVGGAGLVLLLLGKLTFLNNLFSQLVFAAVLLIFFCIGAYCATQLRKTKREAEEEARVTECIRTWLFANITKDTIGEYRNEALGVEMAYLDMLKQIKRRLCKEFGTLNDAYLDYLVEGYYNETLSAVIEDGSPQMDEVE